MSIAPIITTVKLRLLANVCAQNKYVGLMLQEVQVVIKLIF